MCVCVCVCVCVRERERESEREIDLNSAHTTHHPTTLYLQISVTGAEWIAFASTKVVVKSLPVPLEHNLRVVGVTVTLMQDVNILSNSTVGAVAVR